MLDDWRRLWIISNFAVEQASLSPFNLILMTRLKYIIIAVATLVVSILPVRAASPYRGEKTMGLYGGYVSRNESASAGIFFQYRFARSFRIAPSAGYEFRHNGQDAVTIDLDFHTPFAIGGNDAVNIYPLAGVGYSKISVSGGDDLKRESRNSARQRSDRLGINLGGGVEYFASPTLRLAFEAKWRGRTDYSTGLFSLSIGYRF